MVWAILIYIFVLLNLHLVHASVKVIKNRSFNEQVLDDLTTNVAAFVRSMAYSAYDGVVLFITT